MKKVFAITSILLSTFCVSIAANAEDADHYVYYKSSNPTIEITVENTHSKMVSYTLKNENKEVVEKGKAPVNTAFEIDIEDLSAGVYHLEVGGTVSVFEVK